ncbi:protein ycf21 [Porphyridium purpureum]|uniref:Protein ycf21 n=1 Tax=Porphyridium purpureum TaxID=35688 RepID=A0A5J4Z7P7_PORPP|nr:protein ycf21 [Porphyridium purpureum]|eukprot:POR3536..scf295_1
MVALHFQCLSVTPKCGYSGTHISSRCVRALRYELCMNGSDDGNATRRTVGKQNVAGRVLPISHTLVSVLQGSEARTPQLARELKDVHPILRLMIVSDGSVTIGLEALTRAPTEVAILAQEEIGPTQLSVDVSESSFTEINATPCQEQPQQLQLEADVSALLQPEGGQPASALLRRQVLLSSAPESGRTMPAVYACSWWRKQDAERMLRERSLPIWKSLTVERVELHRELRCVYRIHSQELANAFGVPEIDETGTASVSSLVRGEMCARHYIFWHNKQPLAVIFECFNPVFFETWNVNCSLETAS